MATVLKWMLGISPPRVVQHELDHLDGIMFTDKLAESSVEEIVAADLEQFVSTFRRAQADNIIAEDKDLQAAIEEMAKTGIPTDYPTRPRLPLPIPNIGSVKE